jgi:hypothetical protein
MELLSLLLRGGVPDAEHPRHAAGVYQAEQYGEINLIAVMYYFSLNLEKKVKARIQRANPQTPLSRSP